MYIIKDSAKEKTGDYMYIIKDSAKEKTGDHMYIIKDSAGNQITNFYLRFYSIFYIHVYNKNTLTKISDV